MTKVADNPDADSVHIKAKQVVREIETFYLIDYENVNSDGLAGCDRLTKTDHIIIFFTKNAMKINMSEIANHGDAGLDMIEVPAGKQSADIHIGSYIGYLAGINMDKNCSIVVVSKDTDFEMSSNSGMQKRALRHRGRSR